MRRGGPVAGGRGEAVGDHAVEPALDGVELGRGFRGGVEAELLVEDRGGAVAAVALGGGPFFGGVGGQRLLHYRRLGHHPSLALKGGDNSGIGFGAELVVVG